MGALGLYLTAVYVMHSACAWGSVCCTVAMGMVGMAAACLGCSQTFSS